MRKQIRLFNTAGLVVFGLLTGVATSQAQSLQRPVDAEPTPNLSLAALAAQVNPGLTSSSNATRLYTNADLKVRPAPVAPIVPPFPEIAPPSGILEHWAEPGVEPIEREPAPDQYGVPLWDGGMLPFYSGQSFRGRHKNAPDPFAPFRRPDFVHFSGNGDFSAPATASARYRIGLGGAKPPQSGKRGSPSGQGGHGSGRGSKGK